MYTRPQKESSSTSSTSIHKKSNSSESSHSFAVQRQREINSAQEKERPSYSRNAADLLAANVMRSMEARQQGEEAPGAASVTEVVMPKPQLPIAPVASVFQPSRDMAIQRQCSACEQAREEGKDSDEMSSVAGVQRQLTVGAVGDKYEQEADRVAAQVMRMSIPPDNSPQVQRFGEEDNPVRRWSLAQSITPVVHRQVDEQVQMRELVQRAFQVGGNAASGDLESRLNASQGGGNALAPEVRAFMEPRFGADFSSVRVHTGSEAVQMNRELGAQAFTHGSDVYFGAGKSPGNNELTAHELTHVVQQNGGGLRQKPNNVNQVQHKQIQQKIAEPNETTPEDAKICDGTCPNLTEQEPVLVQRKLEVNAHHLFENGVERSDLSSASGQSSGGKSSATGGAGATKAATASQEKSSPDKTEESGKDSVSAQTTGAATSTSSPSSNGSGTSAAATAPTGTSTSAPQAGGTQAPTSNVSPGAGGSTAPPSQGNATAPGSTQTPAASSCTPECYRGPKEEPAEKPETAPSNPPPGQVEAQASEGNEEDLPEIDVCPTAQANAAVAASATSKAPAAATTESASTAGSGSSASNTNVGAASGAAGASGPTAAGPTAAGGVPGGASSGAGDSSIDGVIASAESQRSVAVSAYEESSAALSNVSARTEILRGGVQMAARSGEGQAQQEQSRLVASRAGNFFSAIANRLDEVTAYALGDIPNQLGITAESAKAQIAASMEVQKAAISARTEQARGQAIAEAATARSAVHAQAATYVADVESQTAKAIESLTAKHSEMMAQVNGLETSTLDSINGIYTTGRTDLEGLGTTIGGECTAKGGEFATQYEGFANCTEDGFWDGNLSERRAKAQAEAARSVAKAYHDRMVDAARKRAREVTRNGRQQDRCAIIAAASRSRDTLDGQLPGLINAFEMTRNAAIQQAEATKNNLIVSIDSSLASTLRQLDQQEQSQRQAINDTGYMQQVLQEQIAHTATSAVQKGVQTAVSSVQDAMLDIQAKFASSAVPNPVALENALSQVEQNINAAMDGLNTSVNTGTTTAEAQLVNAVQQTMTSLEGITQSNNELTATLSGGFSSVMNGMASTDNFAGQRTTLTNQIQQSVNASTTALTQILDGFHQSCNTTLTGAQTTLAQAHTSLEQNLRQSKQGLECEIAHKATEAASKEAPAWKQVLAVVLVIIVIVIVVAVTVVTAGGALAGLGPVAVILVGAAIGAVVGGVVSGLLAMASNLWNNRDVMEGVGKAVLIGVITGAAGGAIGAGAGLLFKGASTAVQLGAAMLSSGGVDVVTQYVLGGFSFQNFSWGQLGITLVVTALTFGLAHNISTRAGATPTTTDNTSTTTTTTTDGTTTTTTDGTPTTTDGTTTTTTDGTPTTTDGAPTTTDGTPTTTDATPTTTDSTPTTTDGTPTTTDGTLTTDTPETVPATDTLEPLPAAENSEPLVEQSKQDADNIIKDKSVSKNQRKAMAATSRANPPSGEMTDHFENIVPTASKDGPRIRGDQFPGVEPTGTEGELRIANPDQFIDELKLQYERNGDSPLHPKLEERIRAAYGKGKIFSQLDGIPGLHAEVRAANAALHQLEAQGIPITDDICRQTSIATHRVTPHKEGEPFAACHNCTTILDIFNILTGVTK